MFSFLRILKTKSTIEVAKELLKQIFQIEAPSILESGDGPKFTTSVISEMVNMWRTLKILRDRPRCPQSLESIEKNNHDVKNMLRT